MTDELRPPERWHPDMAAITVLADRIGDAYQIDVASGDCEPSATVTVKGREWIVAGLRLLARRDPAAIRIDAGQIADRAEQLADALPDHIDVDFAVGDDFAEVVVNTTGRALIRDALCALAALGGGG